MAIPSAGISEGDWVPTPPSVRALVPALLEEDQRLTDQLTALASDVTELEEQKGRSSRNSSKPSSSDGPGFKPPSKEKGTSRRRGAQQGYPGHGPGLLPSETCKEVIPHRPTVSRGYGAALAGDDPQPLRRHVVEIPVIVPFVIEHLLHRLSCPCCHTDTTAGLPEGVETSGYGARLSSLVGMLGSVYHLSHRKLQGLLDQMLSITISTGAINSIRCRLSAALASSVAEAEAEISLEGVAHVEETGGPTGNADGNNPEGRRAWLWVMNTPLLNVFQHVLSRLAAAAKQLLGDNYGDIVVSDRFSAYSWLPLEQRRLCWAHLVRDLTAIAERNGASAQVGQELLELEHQLFHHWHHWRDGQINRERLTTLTAPIRQLFEERLQRVSELGFRKGEKIPWASTVRTCRQILTLAPALWTLLDHPAVEPTNNAAERALRPDVIHRKLSFGVQSLQGGLCQSRLLTVTNSLKQQGRDVLEFLVEAWNAHCHGLPGPSLIPPAP